MIATYDARLRAMPELEHPLYWREKHLRHALDMLPQMREFVAAGRIEKAFRWLGFVQGVLWCEGVYTIDEMKRHNMPPEPPCS